MVHVYVYKCLLCAHPRFLAGEFQAPMGGCSEEDGTSVVYKNYYLPNNEDIDKKPVVYIPVRLAVLV